MPQHKGPLIVNGEIVRRRQPLGRRPSTPAPPTPPPALDAGDTDSRTCSEIAMSLVASWVSWRGGALCAAWLLLMFLAGDFWPILFMLGLLGAIFYNTRTAGEGEEGELSSYSVFNEGGQRLAGDLTADALDRQIRGGGADRMPRGAPRDHVAPQPHQAWGAGQTLGGRDAAQLAAEEERLLALALRASQAEARQAPVPAEEAQAGK